MKTKKGDFIEIDFTAKVKDTSQIFDLTKESEAKKHNLFNPKQTYKPVIICLGENEIIKGLDQELIGKETGKEYKIELPPEKAFGKKNPKLMKLIPTNNFKKQKINPFPGLQLNMDGIIGTVRAVSGGRTIVDFNHPLAGKTLEYDLKINKIITKSEEKIKAMLKTEAKIELKDKEAKIHADIPEKVQESLKNHIKKLVPEVKKVTFLKPATKNN
jgi:FKBP-type peptidyl-prolyl cis-trans isomerase SlyD